MHFLDTLITLTKISDRNHGLDKLILEELVVEASGFFGNILEAAIRDYLLISQFKLTAIRTMLPETKFFAGIIDFIYRYPWY